MKFWRLSVILFCAVVLNAPFALAEKNSGEITFIHIGDLHGHLVPRPDMGKDGKGRMVGGLARVYTQIKKIRNGNKATITLNTGDTIQGSAEVLFTKGQAIVNVLNRFGFDAFAPGNWDYVYGTKRFAELFAGDKPKAPWNALACNLYYDDEGKEPKLVLPPYKIISRGGLKIGILGFSSERGPTVVGQDITKGWTFTEGEEEIGKFITILREQEHVDLLVMISELGLARNIKLAEKSEGIDVIFSSDMHEITRKAIVAKTGTVVVEAGQDGAVTGEMNLKVINGKVSEWKWRIYDITTDIDEDPEIAALVSEERKTFVAGDDFKPHVNPINGVTLTRPVDEVVGKTKVPLYRAAFSSSATPAVIEGSSHDFLSDAFRAMTKSDVGGMRGFRYGTHVAPGPITVEDLYHFIPIGPFVAKGDVTGDEIMAQIENSADGVLSRDVTKWSGGWFFAYSGVELILDPFGERGERASNVKIKRWTSGKWEPLESSAKYSYASYHYPANGDMVNNLHVQNIEVMKDGKGNPLDGVELVIKYIQSLPNKTVETRSGRVNLKSLLPRPAYGNPEIQPLNGVEK